jgi:hypothetical protein
MQNPLKKLAHILPLLLSLSTWAADVQMTLNRNLISLLDRAVLKIEYINTDGPAVQLPKIDGLTFIYQGESSETRIVNWQQTTKKVHSYIVTPSKVGQYTIGPIEVNFKGGSKKLTAQLEVMSQENDAEAQAVSEYLFSRVTSTRAHPYVHEPFQLDLYVHVKDGVQVNWNSMKLVGGVPEAGIVGVPEWEVIGKEHKKIEEQLFTVMHLRATVKTITSGTLLFQPQIQLGMVIPRQQRRPFGFNDPFFNDFWGRQETHPLVLDCNPLPIEVKPIPTENRPDSFTGAIGQDFDFNVEVGPSHVTAGDPVTINMKIHGTGNITQVTPPPLPALSNLRQYEASILPTERPNEVHFEQVVLPRSDEITEIPAISFSYFNTETSDFRTITRGPFPIQVKPAPIAQTTHQVVTTETTDVTATNNNLFKPAVATETQIIGRDIIYLKPAPKSWKKASELHWLSSPTGRSLIGAPPILLALLLLSVIRRDKMADDTAFARRKKAPKAARKGLKKAQHALARRDASAFYEAIWETLSTYFGNRLNLAPGEVTLKRLLERIDQPDSPEATQFTTLFEQVDHRRYGIGASKEDDKKEMKELLNMLTQALKNAERMKL